MRASFVRAAAPGASKRKVAPPSQRTRPSTASPDRRRPASDGRLLSAGLGPANERTADCGQSSLAAIFADYAGGDYHLGPGAAVLDQSAVWQPSDPAIDIDGDGRPATAGAPDFAGADRP